MSVTQTAQGKRAERVAALLAHYKLERDPFSGEGMSGLFFPGGDRKNIVEALLHFSRFGNAPQFLSGPPGSGKSSILREFAHRSEKDIDVAVVRIEVLATAEQVSQQILQAFAIVEYGQGDALGRLYAWLKSQSMRARQAILCIDDVQHIDKELLRQLLGLVADGDLAFKIVFAGEIDARPRLESAVENQRMLCNSLELPDLNPQQVGEYAMYLLESAGYRGELPLSAMQLQAAAARSRGSLAQLNELLRDLLVAGTDGAAPSSRWAAFPLSNLLVAAALAAVTIYIGLRSTGEPETVPNKPIAFEKVSPVVLPEAVEEISQSTASAVAPMGGETAGEQPAAEGASRAAEKAVSAAVGVSVVEVDAAGDDSDDIDASSAKVEAQAAAQGDEARIARVRSRETASPSAEPAEVLPAAVALARQADGETPASTGSESREQRDELLAKVFRRLQSWPDEGYALQVFGTHNEARAKKLVEQYFGEADLLFYETRHNGKPWFVVINGPYSGRQTARESIESLPESLRRLRPWPRNIASIKSDILRFDELLGVSR